MFTYRFYGHVERLNISCNDTVINGRDRKGVVSAKSRIDILVHSARAKQPFTHFLSFPVHFEGLQERFAEFKNAVLEDCKGVSKAFMYFQKSHQIIMLACLIDIFSAAYLVLIFLFL